VASYVVDRKFNIMKLFTAVLGTSTIAAISAYAGGVADAIVETAPVIMEPTQTGSSGPSWVIPVIIIAALIGAAALSGDDGDSSPVLS
jgi:hypothetical protein